MAPEPQTFPRRVLVALCGLSPQVVTETIYALAVRRAPAYVPTEVHLLTTSEGATRARLTLLSREPGYFRRLCRDYRLPRIRFDNAHIHELRNAVGAPLDDIRTEDDHRSAANQITEWIRNFTEDDRASVHVSLAGGRKTLGFYAGYALTLLGREQDRLSHVLVTAQFESHPAFYYPPPESCILYTPPPDSRPMDARDAQVDLAFIPFVRLREHLPLELLSGPLTYSAAVAAATSALSRPEMRILLGARTVVAGGTEVRLRPADIAFLAWIAGAARPLECPADGAPDPALAREYLALYDRCRPEPADSARTRAALRRGMEKAFFLERKSRVNRALRCALGPAAASCLITPYGKRPDTRYRLALETGRIRIEPGDE